MNKQAVEKAIRQALKKKHPMREAFEMEVANYEYSLSEIKELHCKNLVAIRKAFVLRGAEHSPTFRKIQSRLKELNKTKVEVA